MIEESGSDRAKAKVANKAVRAGVTRPRAKKARMSKLEAKRLEQFKAVMAKCAGKLSFAGFGE